MGEWTFPIDWALLFRFLSLYIALWIAGGIVTLTAFFAALSVLPEVRRLYTTDALLVFLPLIAVAIAHFFVGATWLNFSAIVAQTFSFVHFSFLVSDAICAHRHRRPLCPQQAIRFSLIATAIYSFFLYLYYVEGIKTYSFGNTPIHPDFVLYAFPIFFFSLILLIDIVLPHLAEDLPTSPPAASGTTIAFAAGAPTMSTQDPRNDLERELSRLVAKRHQSDSPEELLQNTRAPEPKQRPAASIREQVYEPGQPERLPTVRQPAEPEHREAQYTEPYAPTPDPRPSQPERAAPSIRDQVSGAQPSDRMPTLRQPQEPMRIEPMPVPNIPTASQPPRGMYLKLRRGQRATAVTGAVLFMLDARIQLLPDEQILVQKYRLGGMVVYESEARKKHSESADEHFKATRPESYTSGREVGRQSWRLARGLISSAVAALTLRVTIDSLQQGVHIECKSLPELIDAEHAIVEAGRTVKAFLDLAATFDGREEIYEL